MAQHGQKDKLSIFTSIHRLFLNTKGYTRDNIHIKILTVYFVEEKMSEQRVVIGAEHPVAGALYFQVIPDSEVGLVDLYRVTDSLLGGFLELYRSSWRLHEPDFYRDRRQPWHETVIKNHLSMIKWHEDDGISRLCKKYHISCSDLQQWATDVQQWADVPVMVDVDESGFILDIERIDQLSAK